MNNKSVHISLSECLTELRDLETLIDKDVFDSRNRFLILYAIIRATGVLEVSYKKIIVDSFDSINNEKINNYLEMEISKSSKNPSYSNLISTLKKFDDDWCKKFKKEIGNMRNKDSILEAMENLNELRNSFAHGGKPTPSIRSVNLYFENCIEILKIYDKVIHEG